MAAVGRCGRPLQLTLALLKPDAVAHPLVLEAVHETILSNRFLIVRAKKLRCGREESRRFYREHAGRFFYQRLVEFMARYGPGRAGRQLVLVWPELLHPDGPGCGLCCIRRWCLRRTEVGGSGLGGGEMSGPNCWDNSCTWWGGIPQGCGYHHLGGGHACKPFTSAPWAVSGVVGGLYPLPESAAQHLHFLASLYLPCLGE
ncbi:nucleoside diphosphate kinase 6 isoform X2 [Strix uralensis]|uniref:nucleoside diphosphate kinase 6 isoform X2 n=1 Tax=Strix uralensis TaxID=36305 RepID=UPI003DA77284